MLDKIIIFVSSVLIASKSLILPLFSTLLGTFFGAYMAFRYNIRHSNIEKKKDRKTKLSTLVVNLITLSDRFMGNVHLQRSSCWCWNDERKQLQEKYK